MYWMVFQLKGKPTMMVEDKCFSKNNKEASKSELLNS